MYDHNLNKRIVPVPSKEKEGSSTFPLTDTAALVRKVNADLVRNAKAEFAAVMAELNASRDRDESTQPDNTLTEEDEEDTKESLKQSETIADLIGEV